MKLRFCACAVLIAVLSHGGFSWCQQLTVQLETGKRIALTRAALEALPQQSYSRDVRRIRSVRDMALLFRPAASRCAGTPPIFVCR